MALARFSTALLAVAKFMQVGPSAAEPTFAQLPVVPTPDARSSISFTD